MTLSMWLLITSLLLLHATSGAPLSAEGQVQELCGSQCYCITTNGHVKVQCKLANKVDIPSVFPPQTKYLDMSWNELVSLNTERFLNPNLTHLRTLDLSHCHLETLGRNLLQRLPELHRVYLNDNRLTEKEVRALLRDTKTMHDMYIHVDGNLFDCVTLKDRYQKRRIVCDHGKTKKPGAEYARSTSTATERADEANTDPVWSVTEEETTTKKIQDGTKSSFGSGVWKVSEEASMPVSDVSSGLGIDVTTASGVSTGSGVEAYSAKLPTKVHDASSGLGIMALVSTWIVFIVIAVVLIGGFTTYKCMRQRSGNSDGTGGLTPAQDSAKNGLPRNDSCNLLLETDVMIQG